MALGVTQLLKAHREGSASALEELMPLVYGELRKIAARHLRGERRDHTLEPTALVHEAYLKMFEGTDMEWQNRAHFLGVAAHVMRHILVDHARARAAGKRGGGAMRATLDEAIAASGERDVDLVALDDALEALRALDERQARVVELKYFGGLSIEETAEVLGVPTSRVRRDWTLARAWLRRELSQACSR